MKKLTTSVFLASCITLWDYFSSIKFAPLHKLCPH